MKDAALILLGIAIGFVSTYAVASARAQDAAARTSIITDEAAHTVTILIDGKPVAVFNSEGVRVTGDIKFTGVAADIGE